MSKETHAPRRLEAEFMRRLAFALLIPPLFAFGCGESGPQQSAPPAPVGTAGPAASQAAVERTVDIYASVIRQLVTKDHTFGRADPGFKIVYVLDGPLEGAEDSMKTTDQYTPKESFSEDVKGGLQEKLADLPPITFVRERSSVIEGDKGGSSTGHVINNGVLLTLGPIVGSERRVEVGSNLWIDGLAGLWISYVVQQTAGEWKLTGTTGTVAIS
jgi:hypothetical protein